MKTPAPVLIATTLVATAWLAGCGAPGPNAPAGFSGDGAAAAYAAGKADGPTFNQCIGRAFSPAPHDRFEHLSSRLVAALGDPIHSSEDVVALPGAHPTLTAKFAYGGLASKDLEHEWVWVFLDLCDGWHYVGYAQTDDDGKIAFTIPTDLPAGAYGVRVEVVGDGTSVESAVWMLPRGTHLAVFDVDGTLTTDDGELFEELLTGATPEAYGGAVDLTWAELSRKEIVLYLTGRPYYLADKTRGWLHDLGFAPGIAHFAPSNGDALPTDGGVGDYKRAFLNSLHSAGAILDVAYGNATTDVYAYGGAGLAPSRQWIIGPNGGLGGTHAVSGSWSATVDAVNQEPPVTQPFAF